MECKQCFLEIFPSYCASMCSRQFTILPLEKISFGNYMRLNKFRKYL